MLEARLLQHARVHIVLKMAIIKRDADTVESQPREELRVRLREEVLEPLIEEEFVLLGAQGLAHRGPVLELVAGESGYEVLHAGGRQDILADCHFSCDVISRDGYMSSIEASNMLEKKLRIHTSSILRRRPRGG